MGTLSSPIHLLKCFGLRLRVIVNKQGSGGKCWRSRAVAGRMFFHRSFNVVDAV